MGEKVGHELSRKGN